MGQSAFYQSYQKYWKELFIQIPVFFEDIFNKQQCGNVGKMETISRLLTDLFKTFDCLDHELLIAKLTA